MTAVEFALTLPFIILLIFGGYELTTGINTDRRVTAVARTVADLTAQHDPNKSPTRDDIPATKINDILGMKEIIEAGQIVFTPYDKANLQIVVSGVRVAANGEARIGWTTQSDNTDVPRRRARNAVVAIDPSLAIPNTNLIWAEVYYPYTPMFGAIATGSILLKESLFMRPRLADCLTFQTLGCT
ncbi:TadE/TadG family type IV pilus assembly protein [Variibacter gotjawalensis]|nr:TadE/TadG family type IV pilus assembly protein [Variibacter gotjawalensis]NIK48115.1 Flp pilus assembly protein TadG [Variibacter gotjawalensis]